MNDACLHAGSDDDDECNTLRDRAVPQRSNDIIPDCKTFFYIVQHGSLQCKVGVAGAVFG
ncbi:MAG: hypothetical protein FAZ92_03717 [Accumulibacter sp.]|nr:MAG: hypothetical protein FAZ92_03717 [Accumulibacter sp.]